MRGRQILYEREVIMKNANLEPQKTTKEVPNCHGGRYDSVMENAVFGILWARLRTISKCLLYYS